MFTFILLASTLTPLIAAIPTSIDIIARAGGPAIKPIPQPPCTVTNPLPTDDPTHSYLPGPSAAKALFYSAYYSAPSTNKTALAEQCLQQCYGYGDSTECKTAYWADNLVVPAGYYGSPGGNLETGCLFYNRTLTTSDFVIAAEGHADSAYAGNIQCAS